MARESEADYRPIFTPFGSVTIAPSDSAVIVPICRKLYVGSTGDVKVRLLDGSTPTFKAMPVAATLDIQFDMVFQTGTTATLMVGLY